MCGFEGMYHKPQKSNKEINKYLKCASGSVVEYRLAKARVAGSNPVSRSFYLTQESCNSKVSCVFCIEGGDLCTGRAGYRLDSQMSAINI